MWGFCFLAWFSLGCRVTLGLLDDFFFLCRFFCIITPWNDATSCVVISQLKRSFTLPGGRWVLASVSLIWIWAHTDWLTLRIWKKENSTNNKVFFQTCKSSIFFFFPDIVLRTIYNRIPRGWDAHEELICHFIDLYVFLRFVGLFKTE